MTREKWLEHMETVAGQGLSSKGGDAAIWREEIKLHKEIRPDCPECKARIKTIHARNIRQAREEAYKFAGLVKGRTGLGRVIWE